MDGASGAARLPVLRGDVAGRSLQYLLGQQKHVARTAIGASQCFGLRPFDEGAFVLVGKAVDDLVTADCTNNLIAIGADDAADDDVDLVRVRAGRLKFGCASFKRIHCSASSGLEKHAAGAPDCSASYWSRIAFHFADIEQSTCRCR